MQKWILYTFIIVGIVLGYYLTRTQKTVTISIAEPHPLAIENSAPTESIKTKSQNLPIQEKINEPKKSYLTKTEFDKLQAEVSYHFKQSDKDLSMIDQSEDKVVISFGNNDEGIKDMDHFLQSLNIDLTSNVGEYRAFFNRETRQIEIQQLDDFLVSLSEKINSKSKNITNVKLEYETPLASKPLDCVTGEEWRIQKEFHDQSNCSSNSSSHSEAKHIIANFYKNVTLSKNMSAVHSEVFPLWDEIYGKSEGLRVGNQYLKLCYPDNNTIWMEIGCNFRLKIIQKKL